MIGIISNQNSGKNLKNSQRIKKMQEYLGKAGCVISTRNMDELKSAVATLRNSKVLCIGIDGGDGTIHFTLNEIIKQFGSALQEVPIFLLRGGTFNVIAQNIHPQRSSIQEMIERAKQSAPAGVHNWDLIKVNDTCGFLFGVGFPANLISTYEEGERGIKGGVDLITQYGISLVLGNDFHKRIIDPYQGSLQCDGEAISGDLSAFWTGTISRFSLNTHTHLSPHIMQQRISYALLRKIPDFFHALGIFFLGSKISKELGSVGNAKSFALNVKKGIPYAFDGEMFHFETENIHIQAGPTLKFIT